MLRSPILFFSKHPHRSYLLKLTPVFVWRWGLLLLCLATCFGCGSDGPFDYKKVQGKVTYEDGTPLPVDSYRLSFASQQPPVGTAHPRPGLAIINSDGTFDQVTSYKYADGLVPGKHKVSFALANDKDGNPLVPEEYLSIETTPLIVDTADTPFDIKVPRP